MSNSVTLNLATVPGGNVILTDTVSGVDAQVVKIGFSVAGQAPVQVSGTNPMPVALSGTVPVSVAAPVTVTGTVGISGTPAVNATVVGGTIAAGTAGSPSANVVTVQGAASMTPVQITPAPIGSIVKIVSAASSVNLTAIKAAAGQLLGGYLYNNNAAARFVHFYNKAAGSVTVGTDVPLFTLGIAPNSALNLGSLSIVEGEGFTTAMSLAITTGPSDTDTGQTSANDVNGFIQYL